MILIGHFILVLLNHREDLEHLLPSHLSSTSKRLGALNWSEAMSSLNAGLETIIH